MSRREPRIYLILRLLPAVVTGLCCVVLPLSIASQAAAKAYLPPGNQIFAGVTDKPTSAYVNAVGKHPPVYQEFVAWGQYLPGITADATHVRARLMMEITTAYGSREAITPEGIAHGQGDGWLIGLGQAIAASHNITYIRLMAEMDQTNNPYCAYNADGSYRGSSHSPAEYRKAWKRATLILRGGYVDRIDTTLRRLGMPRLRAPQSSRLPRPKVAILWVPQVGGTPDVAGNQPSDYWPGNRWVDWVGTDFYSKFPNFSGLDALYAAYPSKPFVFGEYALWGSDDPGFIDNLFSWTFSHSRTRMLVYNQGVTDGGPFRLSDYPNAARALRHELSSSRFPAYAPEWRP